MRNLVTAEQFTMAVGVAPADDDLERCNCDKPGHFGHWACGWDPRRGMPHFVPGTAKNARYLERGERYEKVFLMPQVTCRAHATVLTAAGQELVVHKMHLLNPFTRVLTLQSPYQE